MVRPIDGNNLNPSDWNRTSNTQPHRTPTTTAPEVDRSAATRRAGLQQYGDYQRDKLERLLGAGAASENARHAASTHRGTSKADKAYQDTYRLEFERFRDFHAEAQPRAAAIAKQNNHGRVEPQDYAQAVRELRARGETAPASIVEVNDRARVAYRQALNKWGARANEVRGTSVDKAVDFLLREADSSRPMQSLAADAVRDRTHNGEPVGDYVVRLVRREYLNNPSAQMTRGDKAWVATVDEITGTKLNVREVMSRIGYDDATINNPNTKASDYVLLVSETKGLSGVEVPTYDNLARAAQTHSDLTEFRSNPSEFFERAARFDYKPHHDRMGNTPVRQYARTLPRDQADLFRARHQMGQTFGMNENYGGEGWTLRPQQDASGRMRTPAERVAVREFLIDNGDIAKSSRHAFVELRDGNVTTRREIVSDTRRVPSAPSSLSRATRAGAYGGAAAGAVTSLGQVFDHARQGRYGEAAQTFGTQTALGVGLGTASAAGERVVGRGIERATSQALGRSASGVFGQVAGHLGGAGVIGGVVSGGISAFDQVGAYRRGEVSGSQAIGTVAGEAATGVGAGLAGAAAGAAVGSIVPIAGTAVGAVVGFGVGMIAGYAADQGLRGLGVDKAIARTVTTGIDAGTAAARQVGQTGARVAQAGVQTARRVGAAVAEGARGAVRQHVETARGVGRAVSHGARAARAYVGERATAARQTISHGTRAAVKYVTQTSARVGQTVTQSVNNAVDTARSTVNQARAAVNDSVNRAGQTISNTLGGASNTLRAVFGW